MDFKEIPDVSNPTSNKSVMVIISMFEKNKPTRLKSGEDGSNVVLFRALREIDRVYMEIEEVIQYGTPHSAPYCKAVVFYCYRTVSNLLWKDFVDMAQKAFDRRHMEDEGCKIFFNESPGRLFECGFITIVPKRRNS